LIANFLRNISAKYKNLTIRRVIAKNIIDFFLRHNVVHSHQCSDYMCNAVSLVSDDPGRWRLYSASSTDYYVLRTRTKLRDRAFSIAGLKAWNNLPQSVHCADSLAKT